MAAAPPVFIVSVQTRSHDSSIVGSIKLRRSFRETRTSLLPGAVPPFPRGVFFYNLLCQRRAQGVLGYFRRDTSVLLLKAVSVGLHFVLTQTSVVFLCEAISSFTPRHHLLACFPPPTCCQCQLRFAAEKEEEEGFFLPSGWVRRTQ